MYFGLLQLFGALAREVRFTLHAEWRWQAADGENDVGGSGVGDGGVRGGWIAA